MTSIAFPFLRILPENVGVSPWLVTIDGGPESALGDRIEKWDYQSAIKFSRSVSVDFAAVAEDLAIDATKLAISAVTSVGTGGGRGDRLRRVVSKCSLSIENSSVDIIVAPVSAELSQTIKLSTELVTATAVFGSRLSPKMPGMRLWSDSQTVHVEPSSAQFPVEVSSFQSLFKELPQGALFHLSLHALDWSQDFANSTRLYINSDYSEFCSRFSAGDEITLRLVMSAIVNQLARRAISNEAFSLDERSSLPSSISGIVRNWILQAFPNQSLESIRSTAEHNPSIFEARLASVGATQSE